jgi:hypothetical protein
MGAGDWNNSFPALLEHTKAVGADINDRVNGLGSNFNNLPVPHDDGTKGFHGPCAVGDAVNSAQAASISQVRNSAASFAIATGTGNSIILTSSFPAIAYTAGLKVSFVAVADSTGGVTVNVDGLGVVQVQVTAAAQLPAGYISAGDFIEIIYTGTFFHLTTITKYASESAKTAQLYADTSIQYAIGTPTEPAGYSAKKNKEFAQEYADLANDASVDANTYKTMAAYTASFRGLWVNLVNSYAVPTVVKHNDAYWNMLVDMQHIEQHEPGVDPGWEEIPDYTIERAVWISDSPIHTINVQTGEVFVIPIVENTEIHLANFPIYTLFRHKTVLIVLENDGNFDITWGSNIRWPYGVVPECNGHCRLVFGSEDNINVDGALCGAEYA